MTTYNKYGYDEQRLFKSVKSSYYQLEYSRKKRKEFVAESAGHHYSKTLSDKKIPVNLMRLAQNILTRKLISSNPKFHISTNVLSLKSFALDFQIALNHLTEEINLKHTLRRLITSAIYSPFSIIKTGMGEGKKFEVHGEQFDIGQPFSMLVDFDNFVIDMTSTDFENVQFAGDIQRVDYEWAMDVFKNTDDIQYKSFTERNAGFEDKNRDKTSNIGRDQNSYFGSDDNVDEFKKTIDIIDLYLPTEQLIVTYAWDLTKEFGNPLEVKEYYGPEQGPYDYLSFNDVDGNLLGVSPASLWYELHDLCNELFSKLSRQAKRQKNITAVHPIAQEDIERIINADDGEAVKIAQPDKVKEMSRGGINQPSYAFFLGNRDLFKEMAGNLDLLGGLGPQSETLGQDQLLAGASSQQMAEMQDRLTDVVRSVGKKLAWYLFHDPFIEMPLVKRIPGIDYDFPFVFSEETREGDFLDYNFVIKEYSMNEMTPNEKMNKLLMIYERIILPAQQIMGEQGINIDFQDFLKESANLLNLNEINSLVNMLSVDGEISVGRERPISSPAPAKTSREYIRKNVSGATNKGNSTEMIQSLLSNPNQSPKINTGG